MVAITSSRVIPTRNFFSFSHVIEASGREEHPTTLRQEPTVAKAISRRQSVIARSVRDGDLADVVFTTLPQELTINH